MKERVAALLLAAAVICSQPAKATESGNGAYLLGSRDTFAGIVPPPGTYITNNFIFMSGDGPTLSLGGVPVTQPELSVYVNKLDIAHFFETEMFGGTPGLVVTFPMGSGDVSGSFLLNAPFGGFKDENTGVADPIITGIVGWHEGKFHYSTSLSVFMPGGEWDPASVTLAPPAVDNILNFGKNRWAFVPALNGTYFNPETGFEVSGSVSITFSTRNETTDWQTAPELNLEAAVLQHLKNGLAFGVTGYAYQQLGEDSGSGAESFKDLLGGESLKARVFGAGPIVTYNTKFGKTPVGFKLKYIHEFEAKRRFESDVWWGSINFSF